MTLKSIAEQASSNTTSSTVDGLGATTTAPEDVLVNTTATTAVQQLDDSFRMLRIAERQTSRQPQDAIIPPSLGECANDRFL